MERFIETEQGRMWTTATGAGEPVLLISGGPGMSDYLEPIGELLERDLRVIRFDPRGCGRSDGDSGYGVAEALADIEALRKAYGYEQWLVVGHSWGADLGLAYALEYPESVQKFVSIAGTGIQNDRDWKAAYTRGKEREAEVVPVFSYPVNKEAHRALIDSWRGYIKEPELLSRLSQSQVETFFLTAEKDIRPAWPIRQLACLMPRAQYGEIAGASHYAWLDRADLLQEKLLGFLLGRGDR
ncbi:proline iminopeptidase [Bacillus sp. JCM 19045]|nr:proline iminopeptidase [Bacillus sp. JCM 19045]